MDLVLLLNDKHGFVINESKLQQLLTKRKRHSDLQEAGREGMQEYCEGMQNNCEGTQR